MSDIVQISVGLLLGVFGSYWLFTVFRKKKSTENTEKQSVILLEKIRNVYKLITVEGEFAEIYHYENVREHFMRLISSKKKALLVINAKVNIGFDLKKIEMHADPNAKKIILTAFPQPEVLSIEPDVKYYDIKEGLFNWFKSDDLSAINSEAKEHILKKIPDSGLLDSAKKEALDAVHMIESMVQAIGWKLDYKTLEIDQKSILKEHTKKDK
ncbi:DUF4230 domain-containing protein [Galbibacter pacificus]|uniref:DUF4230 domain-containing protein n=1 Tax=Galbibacter pacificus TaxID=2996052 RepID=A0ABT6FSH3_9FLAO|nr:DUF4230 domain-containing protein [Galbibacter pacificus]MDG3582667.1 DUF4230 domain-containing protein [Galbibacter pacificus]MDG3586214.1 DUF4230 domain-containing protein [Galbibacter pacificus]